MSKRNSTIAVLGVLIAALFVLIFFEPSLGWRIRQALTVSPGVAQTGADATATSEALKAQLAILQKVQEQLPVKPSNEIRAMVYSRYPLNFKNELLINAGANQGVATGSAVTYQGVLIGQVETVFADTALVRTVFDDGFKLPVRVGNKGYDGLFEGDSEPNVGSIAKNAALMTGDIVYAAAPGLPYGLPIGEIAATGTSPDNLFMQATLSFAYDLNDIETVLITQ